MKWTCTINGKQRRADVPPMKRLLDVLREDLALTGTKEGCGEGECGACTILIDGKLVNSCLVPAFQANGANVVTIEGVDHPMQKEFCEKGGAQCGICTPGMIITATHYSDEWSRRRKASARKSGNKTSRVVAPSRDELREALAGNICRCTGYEKILDSVIDGVRAAQQRPDSKSSAKGVR